MTDFMSTFAIVFCGSLACYALYQWCLLIGGMINGHRQSNQTPHGNSDTPADHGAGAVFAAAPAKITGPAGTVTVYGSGGAYRPVTSYAAALAMAQQNMPSLSHLAQMQAYQAIQNQLIAQNPFAGSGGGGGGYGQVYIGPAQPLMPPKPVEHGGMKLGEIIGYRVWRIIDGGYLKSCSADTIWAPGEPMEGDIGKDGHGLGVHAWKSKSLMLQYSHLGQMRCAIGSIRMWGEIVEHDRGYRSQYASILSIDDVIASGYDVKVCADALAHIRQKYGVA